VAIQVSSIQIFEDVDLTQSLPYNNRDVTDRCNGTSGAAANLYTILVPKSRHIALISGTRFGAQSRRNIGYTTPENACQHLFSKFFVITLQTLEIAVLLAHARFFSRAISKNFFNFSNGAELCRNF